MKKRAGGFTIVELLIVIVIIAILAAITIVSFNTVQARARNASRQAIADQITTALKLYRIDKGYYPSWSQDNSWVTGSRGCGVANGYSFSDATDNTWMKSLVDGGYISKVPTPPNNGCDSYMRYLATGDPTSYGCPAGTPQWAVLIVEGVEGGASAPANASDPGTYEEWKPCPGAGVGFGYGPTAWVYALQE